jgi:hypothetical protein
MHPPDAHVIEKHPTGRVGETREKGAGGGGANSPQGSTASHARWCLRATVRGIRKARSW